MNAPFPFRPAPPETRPLRVCVFGATPATGNLGVTALCHALVSGIARHAPGAHITVLDDRPGTRSGTIVTNGHDVDYQVCGAIPTRRLYRRDSLWRLRAEGRLGLTGAPALAAVRQADAVIDVTGGDSFTDLYGARRFARGLQEKRLVLEQGRPLILAPQTIGPFGSARSRRAATSVLRAASMVWCRDTPSLVTLRDLLGPDFDARHHRLGVDLAFALAARPPRARLSEPIQSWIGDVCPRPVIGLNVSGLLLNGETRARRRFALRTDYRALVSKLVVRVLRETDCAVMLIPHVTTAPGHPEHDPDACLAILDALEDVDRSRVAIADSAAGPAEAKWLISRCTWLCATRMHAAIAALSSGVPTMALAYSGKTAGIFAQCGLAAHVADLRTDSTVDALGRAWSSFSDRHTVRAQLAHRLQNVHAQAEAQLRTMVDACCHARDASIPARRAA